MSKELFEKFNSGCLRLPHEVNAGPEGLYLFAKFFPALC